MDAHRVPGNLPASQIVPNRLKLFREMSERRGDSGPLRLMDYVAVYATTRDIGVESARQYRMAARCLERWAGQPVFLTDLNELMVSAFLREFGESVRPATVRSKRTGILALWRAAADDYLCEPPRRRVRPVRVPWEPREAWSIDEVRRLVEAASRLPRHTREGIPRREWWPLAIRLAWDTGLRKGDLLRLRRTNVHGNRFASPQSKTGRPRMGTLTPSTVRALEESLYRHPRDVLLPWSVCRETFNAQVRLLVRKAGVRPGTWKWLRRGGATDCEAQAPGQGHGARHLGHAPGSKVAEIHYIDPAIVAANSPEIAPREIG